jgi:hypothetical protein
MLCPSVIARFGPGRDIVRPPSALPGRACFEAGMARAKGKRIGRPAIDADLREQLAVRVANLEPIKLRGNSAWIERLR